MKINKLVILVLILSIFCAVSLTACSCGGSRDDDYGYKVDGPVLTVNKPGTVRYEAENVNTSHYIRSNRNDSDIVKRADASGGKFLAAASDSDDSIRDGYFSFILDLKFNAKIVMSAAYAQPSGEENNSVNMRMSYAYLIDENKNVGLTKNYTLASRTDITVWDTVTYDTFTLPQGQHSFRVSVSMNTGLGNPNIDYFEFGFEKISSTEPGEPVNNSDADFHTALQYIYINDENINSVFSYAQGVEELSIPKSIVLDFSEIGNAASYAVEYAETSDFADSTVVKDLNEKNYGVYNLKLGQKIYWRGAESEESLINSTVHNLTVAAQGPRNLYVSGVSNVRDIGGYNSSLANNGKIRQGLYIRGANLNSITVAGKQEMLRLGIKNEIDLRDSYQCLGPYVDGIEYNAVPIPSGTESRRFEEFASEYKTIFTNIANADAKPVYLHCTAGADRTGICTFMLLAVCGASYEDIARDYLFTNFSVQGARYLESEFVHWWDKLDNFNAGTKAEQAKNWLISKGITADQVERIREIFVEGYN